jgi:hypothetical protein
VPDPITIRHSTDADRQALERLAQLEGRRAPEGEVLLAFAREHLIAALPLEGGAIALADPFRRTADVVELLHLRAAQRSRRGGEIRRGLGRSASALLQRAARGAEA